MPYNPDWKPARGWKVNWKSTANPWGLAAAPPNQDRLTFEGSGGGVPGTDIIKKNNTTATPPFADECRHSVVVAGVKEQVIVKHGGEEYIVTLDLGKKELSCRVNDGTGSGGVSWTAVDG